MLYYFLISLLLGCGFFGFVSSFVFVVFWGEEGSMGVNVFFFFIIIIIISRCTLMRVGCMVKDQSDS